MTPHQQHFDDKLTGRQAEVLAFIRACVAVSGSPPTRAEIAEHLGISSVNGAEQHLRALEAKGAIRIKPGASRGIMVVNAVHAQQAVEDLATMRARIAVESLADLDKNCMHCEYEEADGELLRHCDACCRRIVAALGKVRREAYRLLVRARDGARKPLKRSRYYSRTHQGGTLG